MTNRMRVLPQEEQGNPSESFRTVDLGLAAYLSLSHEIAHIERADDGTGRARFIFVTSDAVLNDSRAYWDRNTQVDALTFFHQIKSLKNRIQEIRNYAENPIRRTLD